jgi:hypothetical protein
VIVLHFLEDFSLHETAAIISKKADHAGVTELGESADFFPLRIV